MVPRLSKNASRKRHASSPRSCCSENAYLWRWRNLYSASLLRLASEPEALPLNTISPEVGSAPEREAELPLRLLPQASGRLADAPPATGALKACPSSSSGPLISASDGRKSQMAANRPLCMTSPHCSHASVLCIHSTEDWSNTGTVLGASQPRSQCFNAVLEGHQL